LGMDSKMIFFVTREDNDGVDNPPNAFDFGEFANFDSFTDVPDFNKTTILPGDQSDLSFDAFADFPEDSPMDEFSAPVNEETEEDLFTQDAKN